MFEMAAHIWIKINRIYKSEFSGVSEEASPMWIPVLELETYWTYAEKTFASSFKKWVRKIKIKGVVKRYVLTPKRKNPERFLKIFVC